MGFLGLDEAQSVIAQMEHLLKVDLSLTSHTMKQYIFNNIVWIETKRRDGSVLHCR